MSTFYSFPVVPLIGFFIKSLGGARCPTQVRGRFHEMGLRFRGEGLLSISMPHPLLDPQWEGGSFLNPIEDSLAHVDAGGGACDACGDGTWSVGLLATRRASRFLLVLSPEPRFELKLFRPSEPFEKLN